MVRWLRPDYQIPRFGSAAEKRQLDLAGVEEGVKAAPAGAKPSFPAGDVEQAAAIMAALAAAPGPLGADALAAGFKQGRRLAPKVEAILAAFARVGFAASADGRRFSLRRAA